jgi:hypothetical protein
MTARVDKTESAVGVTRGTLNADIAQADWNKVIGVSINGTGKVVRGGAAGLVVGVIIADKTNYQAGRRCDIIGNGSEIIEDTGLTAGTVYYADATTGLLTTTAASNTKIGYTIEANRLVVTI